MHITLLALSWALRSHSLVSAPCGTYARFSAEDTETEVLAHITYLRVAGLALPRVHLTPRPVLAVSRWAAESQTASCASSVQSADPPPSQGFSSPSPQGWGASGRQSPLHCRGPGTGRQETAQPCPVHEELPSGLEHTEHTASPEAPRSLPSSCQHLWFWFIPSFPGTSQPGDPSLLVGSGRLHPLWLQTRGSLTPL